MLYKKSFIVFQKKKEENTSVIEVTVPKSFKTQYIRRGIENPRTKTLKKLKKKQKKIKTRKKAIGR